MVQIEKKTPTQNVGPERETSINMFGVGRRSAVSTSELGLYSDHSDYYNTNNIYGTAVRKLVIGIMVVVTAILIGIFLYDFSSSASLSSKVNQETKHIYILQNRLKNSSNGTLRKSSVTLPPTIYIVNSSDSNILNDRVDDDRNLEYKDVTTVISTLENRERKMTLNESTSNFQNFKFRNNGLNWQHENKDPLAENKRTITNHAMIYRIRSKHSSTNNGVRRTDEENNYQLTPFRFELKDPEPASFKRQKYPQLTQYRYPHTSRNIQDIIKYLTNDPDTLKRGIKFTGIYIGHKKYDTGVIDNGEVEIGTSVTNNPKSVPHTLVSNSDPLDAYKPKHPSEVNLLATSGVRFSPLEMFKYDPHYKQYYHRLTSKNHSSKKNQYDIDDLYSVKPYRKQQKPKPFSLMLDVYPIIDPIEETDKSTASKSQFPDYELRKPIIPLFDKYSNLYGMYIQSSRPIFLQNQQQVSGEDQKHEMILHLNLHPKQKIKPARNKIIESLISHTTPKEEKLNERKDDLQLSQRRYKKNLLQRPQFPGIKKTRTQRLCINSTQINNYNDDCNISRTLIDRSKTSIEREAIRLNSAELKTIDEEFQQFADSLIAID